MDVVEKSSKDKAVLEEGEIPNEDEEEPSLDNNNAPSPEVITTEPDTATIIAEVPLLKKFKIITSGGSPATAPPLSAHAPTRQVPCPLCGRIFDSYPAMFGHQRVHKDRSYRGAYPPPTFSREGSPLPTTETEEASRLGTQSLIETEKGLWEKPGGEASSSSSLAGPRVLGLDLNVPLEPENEEEEKDGEAEVITDTDNNKKLILDLNKYPSDSA